MKSQLLPNPSFVGQVVNLRPIVNRPCFVGQAILPAAAFQAALPGSLKVGAPRLKAGDSQSRAPRNLMSVAR
jgi:hypothetical protein